VKFFFPDSQDQVDPSFNFETEERSIFRVRQRDDRYPHEILKGRAYTGILVSKAIADGTTEGAGKYSLPQRHRLYRLGVRKFFRLDESKGPRLDTMGDCGAFSYIRQEKPPYSPDEVIDFYEGCGFDYGISVDHVILGYIDPYTTTEVDAKVLKQWMSRRELTLVLAAEFLARHEARNCSFIPVGVAQGWNAASYAESVKRLQKIGYDRIALGGMVPLKTHQVVDCLKSVSKVKRKKTQFHLLGVTRTEHVNVFANFGVTSFDSTSPFRQAFKDDKDNYHTVKRTYTAIRVPQVDANPTLKKRIQAGEIDQRKALQLEAKALDALRKFDKGRIGVRTTIAALKEYEALYDGKVDRSDTYAETLKAAPWKSCKCGICEAVGINVIMFRGSERNKRRGFHNLHAFNRRLQKQLKSHGLPRSAASAALTKRPTRIGERCA
jgi:hypothetical protein